MSHKKDARLIWVITDSFLVNLKYSETFSKHFKDIIVVEWLKCMKMQKKNSVLTTVHSVFSSAEPKAHKASL